MSGDVMVDGSVQTKSGAQVLPDARITVKSNRQTDWVSRGALKLIRGIEAFGINVSGRTCLDVGASTGGFTEVLLHNDAKKVFAVDVGYGQLAWKLRNDPRVIVLERTNARNLSDEHISEAAYLATIDVSFISLRLILPVVETLLQHPGYCLALVKPQFEAGRKNVGKKGVVRDPAIHGAVLEDMMCFIAQGTSMHVLGLTHSPIRGPEGNIEFLCYLSNEKLETSDAAKIDIDGVVSAAHDGTTFSC